MNKNDYNRFGLGRLKHYSQNLWIIVFFIFNILTPQAYGVEKPLSNDILIEGDSLENILDRKLRASGNALLKKGDKSITADLIEFDQTSEKIYAKGNVNIVTPESQISGSELELSINQNTGSIPNAKFVSKIQKNEFSKYNNEIRGTAAMLFLDGENKKRLKDASVTTCAADQDGWFISATDVVIDQSSSTITAKNAHLALKDIPILYSPYLDFSFNSERKSGFLKPTIGGTSRNGMEWAAPYYFNLSPNKDLTVTPRILGKRGLITGAEYRYLDKNYNGISNLEFINSDKKSDINNRYYLNLEHDHNFGSGFSGGFNFEKVAKNDNNYFTDMSTEISTTSQASLTQDAYLSYQNESELHDFNVGLLAQKFQNISTSSPYERLPNVQASYKKDWEDENGFLFLETNIESSYTVFENNNDYAGSRAIGNRFTIDPSISIPIETSYGYIKPKFIINAKSYDLENADVGSKTYAIPTMSIDSGIYLDRPFSLKGKQFTQTLEPRLFYSYTDYKNQESLPMFDSSLMELNAQNIFLENQFGGGDRVMDNNQITAALSSRIIDDNGFEWISTTLAQRFYLEDRDVLKETRFSDSPLQNDSSDIFFGVKAFITKALEFKSDYQYNLDESLTNKVTFTTKYRPEPGKVLNASYRSVKNPNNTEYNIKQWNFSGQWPLMAGWSGLASYNYDILDSVVIEGMGGLDYDAGCWSTQIMFHRLRLKDEEKPNSTLFIQLELGGLGALGSGSQSDLFEKMNRNVPGSVFSSDLPDQYRENRFK